MSAISERSLERPSGLVLLRDIVSPGFFITRAEARRPAGESGRFSALRVVSVEADEVHHRVS